MLFSYVTSEVFGSSVVCGLDFGKPWKRIDLLTEIEKATGMTADDLSDIEKAKKALGDRDVKNPVTGKRIAVQEESHLGGLIEKLLEVLEPSEELHLELTPEAHCQQVFREHSRSGISMYIIQNGARCAT